MQARVEFAEELRKLGVLDQKAASLMNGNALLFACASLADLSKIDALGSWVDLAVGALQLTLLMAGFLALRAARMMERIKKWPVSDEGVSDAEYNEALSAITAVVKRRCRWIDESWTCTMVGVCFLMFMIVLKMI